MVESVLLPVDIDQPESLERPLAMMRRLFRDSAVELHILYVLPPVGMAIVGSFFPDDYEAKGIAAAKTGLEEMAAKADLSGLARPKLHIAHGVVYDEILRIAKKLGVDMIMLGAQKPSVEDVLLGPNAARVARHFDRSVFIVRE